MVVAVSFVCYLWAFWAMLEFTKATYNNVLNNVLIFHHLRDPDADNANNAGNGNDANADANANADADADADVAPNADVNGPVEEGEIPLAD